MKKNNFVYKALKKIIKTKSEKELISESFVAFVIRILSAAVSFVMNIVIARYLGADEAGYFFLGLSIITILATFCRRGSDNIILRFVSIHKSRNEDNEMQSVIMYLLKRCAIFSLLVTPVIVFGAKLISVYIFKKPHLEITMIWMGLSIPFYAGYMLLSYGFQGIKKVSYSITLQGTLLPLLLIVAILLFSVSSSSELSFTYLILSIITLGVGLFWWKRMTTGRVMPYDNKKQLVDESKPLFVVAMLQTGVQWGGQFIAGMYVKPGDLGQLAIAQRTSLLISFVLIAVNLVSAPRFAAYYHAKEMDKLKKYVTTTTRLLVIVSIPMVIVVFLFAQQIMAIFGKGFQDCATLLRILALGQFVNMVTGPVAYLLTMSGHQKELRNITIMNGIFALILFVLLIPKFGAIGAAIATAIAIASQNLMAVRAVRKKLGINTLAIW